MTSTQLHDLLESQYQRFNKPAYIDDDPISIPHRFTKKQDIEITAFWTAMLAWGRRSSIINSGMKLLELMDNAPFDFIINHTENDKARFVNFKHRTFQPLDAYYFLEFLQWYYQNNESLETAFSRYLSKGDEHVGPALSGFHQLFFSLPHAPKRTQKHIATPDRNSACKRLNMFLRWMVRKDDRGVDFGIWQEIEPAQLLIPLDVHVDRVARSLGLITRKQTDWKAVLELTRNLRAFDPVDPGKYDYALFCMGLEGEY